MNVWMNGRLVNKNEATISVWDHGVLYGDGVFEGIRGYGGRIFQAHAHMDRLFRSAERIRLTIPYSSAELIDAIRTTMKANNKPDCYVRLVVTRGPGSLGLHPFHCERPNVFCIVDQIQLYPKEMYEHGMPVIIAKTVRCSANMLPPSVKSLNYLNNILAKIEAIDAGVNEAIMLNAAGEVSEATGDNVFLIDGGTIVTPPLDAGILGGITRGVVIRLAKEMGIPMKEQPFTPDRLYAAQECFLTGTAAEVIAVTTVDGRRIGSGEAGPITRRLLDAFHTFARSDRAE